MRRRRHTRERAPGARPGLARRLASLARASGSPTTERTRLGARTIYIFPTKAGFMFAAVLVLTLLGSLNYQNNLGLLFTFFMGGVGLVAMHHTWFNLLGLTVAARGGAPVFCGEEACFKVTVSDPGTRARADLVVRRDDRRCSPVALAAGASAGMDLLVPTDRRGWMALGRIGVETRYPLGLFRAWCYVMTSARVCVYPRPAPQHPPPRLLPSYRHAASGDKGVGADDYVGPRTYHDGDPLRLVDWKAFARERGLVIKQFGGDRAEQVWIDWEAFPGVEVEERLGLLCRQAVEASERALSFGLRLPGGDVPMGQGDAHRHRVLEALATFGDRD